MNQQNGGETHHPNVFLQYKFYCTFKLLQCLKSWLAFAEPIVLSGLHLKKARFRALVDSASWSTRQAAQEVRLPQSTAVKWLCTATNRRTSKARPGRPPKITDAQLKAIDQRFLGYFDKRPTGLPDISLMVRRRSPLHGYLINGWGGFWFWGIGWRAVGVLAAEVGIDF